MKKSIIVSLLFCVLAGGVFAEITFSGEGYAGIQVEKPFLWDNTVSATHRKEGAPKFNFVATAARENYGIKFDTDLIVTDPFAPRLNGIYGWVDFLDDSIHLSMGKISDAKWVSNLDTDNEVFYDKITGFRVQYKTPLEGLSIGAAFPALGLNGDFNFERMAKKTILGASYIHPMLNSVIAYDMGNNARFLFAFNYTGIDDLTSAGIEISTINLATWDSTVEGYWGELTVKEKVGYRVIRPLIVSLLAGQTYYNDSDTDSMLFFTPSASYRILPALTGILSMELRTADMFKTQTVTLTPCIEYTLKGPALIYVQYQVIIAPEKEDSAHKFGFGIDIKAF